MAVFPVPRVLMAKLMEGTGLAQDAISGAADRAAAFRKQYGVAPCLAAVLVGDDPASRTYVEMKRRTCERAGIRSRLLQLGTDARTEELVAAVAKLSEDSDVNGILVQHPVPPQVDERAAFEAIVPQKDVDGVTMHSFARMALGRASYLPCTPAGIIRLLERYDVSIVGKRVAVIGRSPILGLPMGMLFLARHATVTYCHSRTVGLPEVVREAEIVVAGVGKAKFVRGDWLRTGAVVVDAGYNPGNIGDVAFTEAVERVGLITPVPGGVGPMTIAVLLEQTVDAAFLQAGLADEG